MLTDGQKQPSSLFLLSATRTVCLQRSARSRDNILADTLRNAFGISLWAGKVVPYSFFLVDSAKIQLNRWHSGLKKQSQIVAHLLASEFWSRSSIQIKQDTLTTVCTHESWHSTNHYHRLLGSMVGLLVDKNSHWPAVYLVLSSPMGVAMDSCWKCYYPTVGLRHFQQEPICHPVPKTKNAKIRMNLAPHDTVLPSTGGGIMSLISIFGFANSCDRMLWLSFRVSRSTGRSTRCISTCKSCDFQPGFCNDDCFYSHS